LVSNKTGKLVPTKYLGILKDTVKTIYGSSGDTSTSNDGKGNNMINELVNTGKFTEAEAKELVSKTMQNGADDISTSKTRYQNP